MKSFTICASCNKLNRFELEKAQRTTPTCGQCGAELSYQDGVTELSGLGLAKLIASSPLPVVADFWAPWCGPCKVFAPIFKTVAQELGGQYVFAKLNTEAYPLASDAHQIKSIPTLILFAGGIEITREMGAMPSEVFKRWLTQAAA